MQETQRTAFEKICVDLLNQRHLRSLSLQYAVQRDHQRQNKERFRPSAHEKGPVSC